MSCPKLYNLEWKNNKFKDFIKPESGQTSTKLRLFWLQAEWEKPGEIRLLKQNYVF